MRILIALLMLSMQCAFAQAPVVSASPEREASIGQAQRQASAAYRSLQQLQYDREQAERDVREADRDYQAELKRADEFKSRADAARKSLADMNAKEALARKNYEAAMNAVDRLSRPAAK